MDRDGAESTRSIKDIEAHAQEAVDRAQAAFAEAGRQNSSNEELAANGKFDATPLPELPTAGDYGDGPSFAITPAHFDPLGGDPTYDSIVSEVPSSAPANPYGVEVLPWPPFDAELDALIELEADDYPFSLYDLGMQAPSLDLPWNFGLPPLRQTADHLRASLARAELSLVDPTATNLDPHTIVWSGPTVFGHTVDAAELDTYLASQYIAHGHHHYGERSPLTAAVSSDGGETLATGTKDGLVTLWEVTTRSKTGTFERDGPIRGLAFSPDGKTLASGSWQGVRLWDSASRKELAAFPDLARQLTFSPDGTLLAGLSGALNVRLWQMVELRELEPIEEPHTSITSAVAFSPDGKVLATGSWDTEIKLWDAASRHLFKTFKGHQGTVNGLTFSPPDGQILASASDDGTVRLWPAGDRGPSDGEAFATLRGHTDKVHGVAFSPDGKTFVSCSADGTVKLWPRTMAEDRDVLAEDHDWVYTVAFSPDDRTLATGCFDGTVRLCDVGTLRTKEASKRHAYQVFTVAFSPSGQWLASCDGVWRVSRRRNRGIGKPGEVKLSSLGGRQPEVNLPEITTGVRAAAFSPDGTTLAIGDHEGRLRIWDIAGQRFIFSKQVLASADGRGYIQKVRFAPDGKTLAAVHGRGDRTVSLSDAATGELLATFEPTGDYDVAFSPDGETLATGGAEHTVKLWDVRTQRELISFEGHKAQVMAICFSPDGKTLATGSVDHTIKLWSVESGQDVATLNGHDGPVSGLAFSHDGTILASSGQDKTVRLWRAASIEEVRQATAPR